MSPQLQPPPKKDNKVLWIVVVVVIVVIAIPMILSAVMYFTVFGTDGSGTPTATFAKATITNGEKITVVSISRADVSWDDITVQLSDGMNFATWTPTMTDMSTAGGHNYSGKSLGSLTVYMNAYPLVGNGYVFIGDYATFQTAGAPFSSSTQYSVTLVYEPTGEQIGTASTFMG